MACDKQLRSRTTELTELSRHLFQVVEEEKADLARVLHDTFGSNLTAINMDLNWIAKRLPPERPELGERLQRVLYMLRQTVEFKQRIIDRLRPSHLDTLGLTVAVRSQCHEVAQRTGKSCEIEAQEDFEELDSQSSIAMFRVAQEALAIVARNANAARLRVELRREGSGVRMLIGDEGADAAVDASGLGLIGMRERMSALGGTLTLIARESGGTVIDAYLPVRA